MGCLPASTFVYKKVFKLDLHPALLHLMYGHVSTYEPFFNLRILMLFQFPNQDSFVETFKAFDMGAIFYSACHIHLPSAMVASCYIILERIGHVAYRLRLSEELSGVHDTFHVSNLKKYLADANLHVPLDEIKLDKTLCFVEEPLEITDHEVKTLKRSKIPIMKVRWNFKRGPEFTWEREDHLRMILSRLMILCKIKWRNWNLLCISLAFLTLAGCDMSNLKKCLVDPILQVPLNEIRVDAKLNFMEDPVEILEREFKKLK
ncbi:hypothetical protein Tco_0901176 [Tanacetum coccineum]